MTEPAFTRHDIRREGFPALLTRVPFNLVLTLVVDVVSVTHFGGFEGVTECRVLLILCPAM